MDRIHLKWQFPVYTHCQVDIKRMIGDPEIRNNRLSCCLIYRTIDSHLFLILFCIFSDISPALDTSIFCFAMIYSHFKAHYKCFLLGEILLDSPIQRELLIYTCMYPHTFANFSIK